MIRTFQIAVLCFLGFCLFGCENPDENSPLWKDTSINELAPKNPNNTPNEILLKTINFDLHTFEIPANNIRELDEIRRTLDTRSLQFINHLAFSANSFSVYFGQNQTWNTVYDLLLIAGAQTVTRMALMLPSGETENIIIKEIYQPQIVYYTSSQDFREGVHIDPGVLALRIKVENPPILNGTCNMTACPVYTLLTGNTIPELDTRLKLRDFTFDAAAFRLNMKPGDFIFLAPEKYIIDQSTLCGLFFSNPQGRLFFNENKIPERKPAVRVYLLACVGVNY
jgi:hypothetical protein